MATKATDTTPAENIQAPIIVDEVKPEPAPAPAPGVDAPKPVAVEQELPEQVEPKTVAEKDLEKQMENVSLDSPAPVVVAAPAPVADGTLPIPAAATATDNQPTVAAVPEPKVDDSTTAAENPAAPADSDNLPLPGPPTDAVKEQKDEPLEPLAAALDSQMVTEPTKAEAKAAPTALDQLYVLLPEILMNAEHGEIWGIQLDASTTHVPTTIVLQKFLRANHSNVEKAKQQLVDALKWRKKMDPVALVDGGEYSKEKFGGLGYVTEYAGEKGQEVVTWNIYGAVKDTKATFGDVDEFMKWRTAVMELSIRSLNLTTATEPLKDGECDPYQMIQIHDYSNVSFIRMDPAIKACSKATITAFALAYPELLSRKFFVNVPLVMSWVFQAVKLFVAKETVRKFNVLGYGNNLAGELDAGVREQLPAMYGGKGGSLTETGKEVKLV